MAVLEDQRDYPHLQEIKLLFTLLDVLHVDGPDPHASHEEARNNMCWSKNEFPVGGVEFQVALGALKASLDDDEEILHRTIW